MKGLYYQTLHRDDSKTIFSIQPLDVCEYAVDGLITCIGHIGFYAYRMPISIEGTFHDDGIFYVSKDCILDSPDCRHLLLEYLAPWLNESQKKKITIPIKEISLDYLISIGIKKEDAKDLIRERNRLIGKEKVSEILLRYGIDRDIIESALRKNLTEESLMRNPYTSCLYNGINIYYADAIAAKYLKINPYAPIRLFGFILDAMILSKSNGNTCITPYELQKLINYRMKYSIYPKTKITMALLNMCIQDTAIIQHVENGKLYLYEKEIYEEENCVLKNIQRLIQSKHSLPAPDIDKIEQEIGIKYNNGQRNVFRALESTGIKILTGPPGAGKTATIQGLIHGKKSIRLAATTGRASQVLKEACQLEAVTVYKLLDIRPYGENLSLKNANNPIQAEIIVIDEISMAGLKLAAMLLQAVKNDTILILVGDEEQLQSVEYGNFLSDLIHSGIIEIYRLTEIMRFDGSIRENALRINQGNSEMLCDSYFHIEEFEDENLLLKRLISNVSSSSDYQILSTIKGTPLGTKNINSLLQDKTTEFCISFGGTSYYKGNRIIMCQTNYEKEYYNGDMGTVIGCRGNSLEIQVDGRIISLDRDDLLHMELAYGVTIHKSQGSGFSDVHVILPSEATSMLTRRMLYTAITRGKQRVWIYSIRGSFVQAVKNTQEKKRSSLLLQRLISLSEKIKC